LLVVLALCAGAATACDDEPVTPIDPTTPITTTETFSGTLNLNGAVTHQFSTTSRGAITATLTKLDPDAALTIGVSLGTWNVGTSSCTVILANDSTAVGSGVLGAVSGVGILCLRVYDPGGKVTPSQTYSVDVVHP
jgi:hypothetical protein